MANSPTYPTRCPECGAPVIHAEVTHVEEQPREPMGPPVQARPAAATYCCQRGHEWIRDLERAG